MSCRIYIISDDRTEGGPGHSTLTWPFFCFVFFEPIFVRLGWEQHTPFVGLPWTLGLLLRRGWVGCPAPEVQNLHVGLHCIYKQLVYSTAFSPIWLGSLSAVRQTQANFRGTSYYHGP